MNFAADPVQTQTPQFMDMGLSTINALDEGSGLSTPNDRIRRPTNGAHWRAPNYIFGKTTVVGVNEAKSDYDYNYKTEFQIWRENKEFERQKNSMSQPPLEWTPVGTNKSYSKIKLLESTTVGAKMPDPKPLTLPTKLSKRKEKVQKE